MKKTAPWSEKELRELMDNILSGLKSGLDFNAVVDCLKAPDQMILEALTRMVEQGEVDVLVT